MKEKIFFEKKKVKKPSKLNDSAFPAMANLQRSFNKESHRFFSN